MTFDLEKVLQSKRELRRDLAARPIAEKLAMLDELRDRTLALRAATPRSTRHPYKDESPIKPDHG